MKINKKQYHMKNVTIVLTIMLLSSFVCAWGVGSQYSEDYPATIYPGQSIDVQLLIRSHDPIKVEAEVVEGADIAKIKDFSKTYNVPDEGGALSTVSISIPEGAMVGSVREVKLKYTSVEDGEGGTVSTRTGIYKSIPVLVVEKPAEPMEEGVSAGTYVAIILGILILLVVISIILKNKKKGKKKK